MDAIGGFDPPVVGLAVARNSLYFMNWGLQHSINGMCHHPPLLVNLIFILFWQLHKLHFHTTMFHAFRKVDPFVFRMFLEVVCRTRILIFKYKIKQDILNVTSFILADINYTPTEPSILQTLPLFNTLAYFLGEVHQLQCT